MQVEGTGHASQRMLHAPTCQDQANAFHRNNFLRHTPFIPHWIFGSLPRQSFEMIHMAMIPTHALGTFLILELVLAFGQMLPPAMFTTDAR